MRKFKLGVLALGAALALGVGAGIALRGNKAVSVSADSATITPSQFTAVANTASNETISGIKFELSYGTITSDQYRVFKNSTLTITAPANYNLKKVEMSCTASGTNKYGPGCFATMDGYSYNDSVGTWTGEASSITFTASTNQVRVSQFVINYESKATTNPEITLSDNEATLINTEGTSKVVTVIPNSVFSATPAITVTGKTGSITSVNVAISGLSVTLTPKAVGSDTLVITATNNTQVATAEFSVKVLASHGRVENDPFTVAEAIAAIDNGDDLSLNVYVSGKISQIDEYSNGSMKYWISDDGTTTNQFEIFWGKNVGNVSFTAITDLALKADIVNYGKITKYGSTYEFTSGSYLVSYNAPQLTLVSIALSGNYATEFVQGATFSHEGLVVTATFDDESTADVTTSVEFKGYDMSVVGEQTVIVSYTYNEVEKTTSYNITVVERVAETYELLEDATNLKIGDKVFIAASEFDFALSTNQKSNNRGDTAIVKDSNGQVTPSDDVQILTIEAGNKDNTVSFYTGSGYLYASSSTANQLKTESSKSDNSSFAVTITSGVASIVAQGANTRNVMQYNSGSNLFACYASASQAALALYKKVESVQPSAAEVFAEKILSETQGVCAGYVDKVTDYATQKAALEDIWTTLSSEFTLAALDETELAKLVSAEGKEDGTTIEQAMYRYDFLTAKYGLTNFITGRVVAQAFVGINPAANNANVNMLAIIIIASVALVTTTGAITAIIIKKRVSR